MDEVRFDVRSSDGTSLAAWVLGGGPPLVLVHGALSDHTNDRPFIAELGRAMSTYAMDRRGRGASEDGPVYSIEREFEDVAAVIDAVAVRSGERVSVWGHSYGADCAMGAATLTDNIEHLILYEPGLGMHPPPGSVDKMQAALDAGDREAAVIALFRDVVEMTADEVAFTQSLPTWSTRLGLVHTVPRELRAEGDWVYHPGQFHDVTARTLVLAGSESPPEQAEASQRAADAIPGAEIEVLRGHGHIAHRTDPDSIVGIIRDFTSAWRTDRR